MMDFTGASPVGTRPHTHERVEPSGSVPLINLGFVPDHGPTPPAETALDRHTAMAQQLADPAGYLLTAIADWAVATHDHEVEAVALVQGMDMNLGGMVAEGLTGRQCAILANLLRRDTDLRAVRGIPSAPAVAGVQR